MIVIDACLMSSDKFEREFAAECRKLKLPTAPRAACEEIVLVEESHIKVRGRGYGTSGGVPY